MIHIVPLLILICAGWVVASCQPQTKRDRAGVGPATESPTTPPISGNTSEPDASTDWTLNQENWEDALKILCEKKNISACTQLAFEAQRRGRTQEAISYFNQSCLGNAELSACSYQVSQNARSCFELSKIYETQGRSADALSFKNCSCARRFKPAC